MIDTNTQNTKRLVIGLGMIWLVVVVFNFADITSLDDPDYYFPQGDNQYYLYNLITDEYESIVEFKNSFFFGTTYFQYNNIDYIGVIEWLEVASGFQINFKYFSLDNPSEVITVNLANINTNLNQSVFIQGLSTRIENQSLVFSTIWKEGDPPFSLINYVYEFNLNGEMINKIPIESNIEYTTPHDVVSLSNGSYVMIFSMGRGEITISEGNHIGLVSPTGNLTYFVTLKDYIRSMMYDYQSNKYFTIAIDSTILKFRDLTGNTVNTVNLNREYSEIDYVDGETILLNYYVNPFNKSIPRALTSFVIIFIPLIIVGIHWRHKKYKWVDYPII